MTRHRLQRRAFSLLESVVVVVMLSVAIPPTLVLMDNAARDRADQVTIARATALATGVLEQVIADTYSEDAALGFDALADPSVYLTTPGTGLLDRLDTMTSGYDALGITYTVGIGPLVSQDGAVSGVAQLDVFRLITVTVTLPSARETSLDMSVSAMVTQL